MNHMMWKHPATQRNVNQLRADGVRIVGPDDGPQACGEFGPGRMLEPEALCDELVRLFGPRPLAGKRVLDNRRADPRTDRPGALHQQPQLRQTGFRDSRSGARCRRRGHADFRPRRHCRLRAGAKRIDVITAQQMHDAVTQHVDACDIFIGVAAVADFRPAQSVAQKIKKKTQAGLVVGARSEPRHHRHSCAR